MRMHMQRTVSGCYAVLTSRGTVEAGLLNSVLVGLPSSPTSVGDERGSTAHLWSVSHRLHLGCTHHSPLAPSPGEGIVQDGSAYVQDLSWSRTAITESSG